MIPRVIPYGHREKMGITRPCPDSGVIMSLRRCQIFRVPICI